MTQKNAEEMWKQISTNLRMTELENYQELHKESDTRESERKNQKIAKGWNKKAMVVEYIRGHNGRDYYLMLMNASTQNIYKKQK